MNFSILRAFKINYFKTMNKNCLIKWIFTASFLLFTVEYTTAFEDVIKRSAGSDETISYDYPEYQIGVKYDEYPVVVPKRAALLLDRLMVALKNAMEDENIGLRGIEANGKTNLKPRSLPISQEDSLGMERRGHGTMGGSHKGRVYWRCYFNAVTCFKRK